MVLDAIASEAMDEVAVETPLEKTVLGTAAGAVRTGTR